MGVYIKGVEMPTDCALMLKIFPDGRVGVPVHLNWCGTMVVNDAEAVPVPPHGRLGDLDKLEEKIDGIWDCNDMVFEPDDHCCNVPEDCKGCKWAQTKDCIQRMVVAAPTIIPVEEGEI